MNVYLGTLLSLLALLQASCSKFVAPPPPPEAPAVPEKRIVGGAEPSWYDHPWFIALRYANSNQHFCGGALLDASTIITAAHCLHGLNLQNDPVKVVAGLHNINYEEGYIQERTVSSNADVVIHSGYDPNQRTRYDFALIKVQNPFYSEGYWNVGFINLPDNPNNDFNGVVATVYGFGSLFDGTYPAAIQALNIQIWSQTDCTLYGNHQNHYLGASVICAGGNYGQDACFGDSGGPLVNGQGRLVGIVSGSLNGCGAQGEPGIYGRVTSVMTWIFDCKGYGFSSSGCQNPATP